MANTHIPKPRVPVPGLFLDIWQGVVDTLTDLSGSRCAFVSRDVFPNIEVVSVSRKASNLFWGW